MGYLSELTTMLKTASSGVNDFKTDRFKQSLAKASKDGILHFSVVAPDTVPVESLTTIAKMVERVYASFAQVYISMNNTVDISIDKNPSAYIRKLHKNITLESTDTDNYYDYVIESSEEYDELTKRVYNGTTKAYINEACTRGVVFNFTEKLDRELFESNKSQLESILSSLDLRPLEEASTHTVTPPPSINKDGSDGVVMDPRDSIIPSSTKFKSQNDNKYPVPKLVDNDVKKLNDIQPLTMQVRLMAVNSNKEFVQFMDFVVGIKAVSHVIKSRDMINNISRTLQNNGALFNFIRWTTGEKTFFRDLVLHLNDTRSDMADRNSGSSPWWSTLKRLKNTSSLQKRLFMKNNLVPNTTFVLTSFEVDEIRRACGQDVSDIRFATKLMKNLFLMNLIILNEETGMLSILYDGDKTFHTYSMDMLEREVSLNSNKLNREIGRMISR